MAIFALALIVEITATFLTDTPQLRHPLDRLIYSMNSIKNGGDIILFGDSVTQDIARKYALAPGNRVVNLTTNKASGMTGAYLLLHRYLGTNQPPGHIVVAATPEFFGYSPDPQTAKLYLSSVFTTAEEQRYLRTIGLAHPKKNWTPAIFKIEESIFNRVTGLLFRSNTSDNISYLPQHFDAPLKGPGGNAVSHKILEARYLRSPFLDISKSAQHAIQEMCVLSRLHKFELHIITAPIPKSVYLKWKVNGRISKFQDLILKITDPTCHNTAFTDINEIVPFPDHAFRDSDHLRRPGWANLYARTLRDLIANLK
jgi:hypothetical protein